MVLVPQEGFLFDASLEANLAFAVPGATRADVVDVVHRLGLGDWVDSLALGLDTPVGQRGESLSVGERQLSPWPGRRWPTLTCSSSTRPPLRSTR